MTDRLTNALLALHAAFSPMLNRRRLLSVREAVRAKNAFSEAIEAAKAVAPALEQPAETPACAATPEAKFRAAVSAAHTQGLGLDRISSIAAEVAAQIEGSGAVE